MLHIFWAIGIIIVNAVTSHDITRLDDAAYRIPIALQWMFLTPLAILLFLAPESPWWLNIDASVTMVRRTIDLEKTEKENNYLELLRNTGIYRIFIVCGVYAA
ncbi:uncharacterized protein J7T54_000561 [Emericellopsis cladophorae]|uniref:Uncharacterized protein n=1 Tax=Emericellopsis cladophorae TaxID=2686198 RepID=A0A9Q0BAH6_9HYPO|nr:uncharacterized protein J7T54_000561 [Emericellopsis cladophorae]KAI6777756.1 hypothetical protein J7T54_000561 [Emericellopsis cladophorae]